MNNFQKGLKFEKLASQILKSKKIEIIKTRIKSKIGEIDILGKFKDNFYIVEVKYRKSLDQAAYSISRDQFKRSILTFFDFTQKNSIYFEKYFYLAILFCQNQYKIINVDSFLQDY